MKRITTDTPQDNLEIALNLFYIKDHETWVRGGGPAPDFKDVSLFDFTRSLIKAHIPTVETPENDNDFSFMMAEWLFDDADSAEGTIATLYTAAWAYAELRHRLMAYENTGLEPAEIAKVKAERDAAISELARYNDCVTCNQHCGGCSFELVASEPCEYGWQWRGTEVK